MPKRRSRWRTLKGRVEKLYRFDMLNFLIFPLFEPVELSKQNMGIQSKGQGKEERLEGWKKRNLRRE
jgi:hypothetical protein